MSQRYKDSIARKSHKRNSGLSLRHGMNSRLKARRKYYETISGKIFRVFRDVSSSYYFNISDMVGFYIII